MERNIEVRFEFKRFLSPDLNYNLNIKKVIW